MQVKKIIEIPADKVDRLTALLPFFREVKQQDEWQYNLLLQSSRVVTYGPGETVLEAGGDDKWLCFLVRGQLSVLVGAEKQQVNVVSPGEIFGDLAMLLKQPRSATVAVPAEVREAVVFEVDFSVFGELSEVHHVNLATKLSYYRNLLLGLRWKLEVYRNTYPQHEIADAHRKIKLYVGEKDTMDELLHLDQQAQQLAKLLILWNQQFGRLAVLGDVLPKEAELAEIDL